MLHIAVAVHHHKTFSQSDGIAFIALFAALALLWKTRGR